MRTLKVALIGAVAALALLPVVSLAQPFAAAERPGPASAPEAAFKPATGPCAAGTLCASTASAIQEPLIAKLAEVDDAVKGVAPVFGCYDQTDPKSCQQMRGVSTSKGTFTTSDFATGDHVRCFSPLDSNMGYRVCRSDWDIWPEIFNGSHWTVALYFDSRCDHWGGPYSAEYLACEAALPPK